MRTIYKAAKIMVHKESVVFLPWNRFERRNDETPRLNYFKTDSLSLLTWNKTRSFIIFILFKKDRFFLRKIYNNDMN